MDFGFNGEQRAFLDAVKAFLREECTPEVSAGPTPNVLYTKARLHFMKEISDRGWLGIGWPKEYGGVERPDRLMQLLLNYELQCAGGPGIGKFICFIGNTLLKNGSEKLKNELLPRLATFSVDWGIAYTEPEAASDLASLQTVAVPHGNGFSITGHKRFISTAHTADFLWLAARTDTHVPKEQGITLFVVDAKAPGITIVPMYHSAGERSNEVYLDDVKVGRDRVVGEINKGWGYVCETLNYEWFTILGSPQLVPLFRDFVEWVKTTVVDGKPLREDLIVRRKIAQMALKVEAGRMLHLRCCWKAAQPDADPTVEAAMDRFWWGMEKPNLCDLILDIEGPWGYLWQGEMAPAGGHWNRLWAGTPHGRFAAGGVENTRDIIARRLLGMPTV